MIVVVNMAVLFIYARHFNCGNVPSPWSFFYNSAVKCCNNHDLLLLEKPQKHVFFGQIGAFSFIYMKDRSF